MTFKSPSEAEVPKVFGPAGGADATAGRCLLPWAFPLAWDSSQRVASFACHKLVAAELTAIFSEAARHYGKDRFIALGLDQFGGCYNHRLKRGGTTYSMHSWGIAVDIDPGRNPLKADRKTATLARPDCDAWWRIVEAHGAFSLGRVKNYDWMHFQFARI